MHVRLNSDDSSFEKKEEFLKEIYACDESENFNSFKKEFLNESGIEKALKMKSNDKRLKYFEKK